MNIWTNAIEKKKHDLENIKFSRYKLNALRKEIEANGPIIFRFFQIMREADEFIFLKRRTLTFKSEDKFKQEYKNKEYEKIAWENR